MNKIQKLSDQRNIKLNRIEKLKETKNPISVYKRIEEYAKNGYDSIPKEDKNYFLKCFGIFDKAWNPNEFMLRIRTFGGNLNYKQAIALGEVAQDFGRDCMDLTTRAQVELRYVAIENIPTLLKKLNSVGITLYQTGVDNFRGIVTDPLDDLAFDNILPSQKTLIKMQDKFLGKKEWISAIPRKFNTSIVGSISNRCNAFGHDCCFILAQKEGIYGYNLYLGGKVGKIAQNTNIFLKDEEELLSAYEAIIRLFKKYGFKDSRNRNRFFFLIESVGMEEISKSIREYSGINFATSGTTLTKMDNEDADQGKSILKDGTFAVHSIVLAGVFSGSDMIEVANISKKYGSGNLRLDIEQNLYLMNIKKENINKMKKESFFTKYKNSPYANHLIACAGEKHCQYGVIPNKPDAIKLVKYLEKKVSFSGDAKIRLYWSGCVKGCGLHDLGDIGFEGCKAKVNGINEYGVHIFVGGRTTKNAQIGYSVLKSVPLKFAHLHIESLVLEYKRLRQKDETFESFNQRVLNQYTRSAIGFIMMLKTYLQKENINIDMGFKENIKTGKNEYFEIFEIGSFLYKEVMRKDAYQLVKNYMPIFPRKLNKIDFKKTNISKNLVQMINKMVDKENPAIVFSELTHFIKLD